MKIYIVYASCEHNNDDYIESDIKESWNIVAVKSEKIAKKIVSKFKKLHKYQLEYERKVNKSNFVPNEIIKKFDFKKSLNNEEMNNWKREVKIYREKFKEENYKIPENLLDVYSLQSNIFKLKDDIFENVAIRDNMKYDYHEIDLLK